MEQQLRRTVFQTVHPDWKSGLQNTKSFFLAPLLRLRSSVVVRAWRTDRRPTYIRDVETSPNRRQAIEDLIWAVINTNEFMFQY